MTAEVYFHPPVSLLDLFLPLFIPSGRESALCPVWLSLRLPADDQQAGRGLPLCDPAGGDGGSARRSHRRAPHLHDQGQPRLHLPQDLKVGFLRVSQRSLEWNKRETAICDSLNLSVFTFTPHSQYCLSLCLCCVLPPAGS